MTTTIRELSLRPQLDITCRFGFGAESALDFLVGDEALAVGEDGLRTVKAAVEPPVPGAPEPQVRLVVCHTEGTGYRIDAWTELSTGSYETWDGDGRTHRYRVVEANGDPIRVVVAIVAVDEPPPSGPPAPGSGGTVVKVEVRKRGATPFSEGAA